MIADSLPKHAADADSDLESGDRLLATAGIHHRRGGLPWFLAAAGRFSESIAMGESFIKQASALPSPGGLVGSATGHASHGLGIAYAAVGRPDDSRQAFLRAREIYRELDHHGVIAISYLAEMRSMALSFEVDQPDRRRNLARESIAALAQAGGAMPVGTYSATC